MKGKGYNITKWILQDLLIVMLVFLFKYLIRSSNALDIKLQEG